MHYDDLPEILPPSENGIFQSTFTREGAEPALREFLTDILERPLKKVSVRNAELPLLDVDAKREVFDINCIAEDDKSQMDVEMQTTPMEGDTRENKHRNIITRSVFNLSDLHANQPGRGVRYGDFYRSYQIMICNYKVFDRENELIEVFTYRNKNGIELSDITTAIFIDLTKVNEISQKTIEEMTPIEQWVVFLAKANDPKYWNTIERIIAKKEGIQVAYEMLTTISTDEKERAHYRSRRMWQMDRDHEIASVIFDVNTKWEGVVADKDAKLAENAARIAELERRLGDSK